MKKNEWNEIIDCIDDETGVCYDYYMNYRNGSFLLSLDGDSDSWTILFYERGVDGVEMILKEGLKSLTSAKRYFTQNANHLKGRVDSYVHDEYDD